MPQPIRKACHAELSGLYHRPEHAAALGRIVSVSGKLESSLGWLLALFSGGNAMITISMFHCVHSTDAQKAMLLAAAKHKLRGAELDAFNDLMEDFRPRYTERNKLVHNLWGHSNDHPDKALWWRSTDWAGAVARMADAKDIEALGKAYTEDISLTAMAYTVKDLEEVGARLAEYSARVSMFVNQMLEAHPALVAAANAATNAPPIGEEPQLGLHQTDRTAP